MLQEQTLEKLHQMRLRGLATAFEESLQAKEADSLSFEERFGLMVDREWNERQERSLKRRLQIAKLRASACLEDVNYRHSRNLDRSVLQRLATCQWIRAHENVVLTGPTGLGKTWLACALANKACRQGFSAMYRRIPRLFQELQVARADGSYTKLLARIAKAEILILDDWGLSVLADEERRDLLEVLEDRHGTSSTIVTSQLPIEKWHDTIGEPTIADAIMDRLIHNAHRIELSGPSLRKSDNNTKPEQ